MGKIKDNTKTLWNHTEQVPIFVYLLRWLMLSALSGAVIGSGSALLLVSLEWATRTREEHLWLIALLPLAGLLIGLMYHYWAGTASKGNNYLIEEIRSPNGIILREASARRTRTAFCIPFRPCTVPAAHP